MIPFSRLLRSGLPLWEKIASPTVVSWIKDGISLPFRHAAPEPFCVPNRYLPPQSRQFITSEIKELLRQDIVEKVTVKPHCISPVHCVPKKTGKFRLIHDLRLLNSYCGPPSFSNEGITEVLQLIKPDDVLVTFDIKSGFHHVPINASDRKYLGFEWQGHFYQWKCLPFGLNSSPYFFYKIIRPVVQYLRGKGLRIVAFVDDFLLMTTTERADRDKNLVLDAFRELGLQPNFEKSSLTPEPTKQYIGYIIKTVNSDGHVWLEIPRSRIKSLRHDISRLLRTGKGSARALARVAGQCVSMCKVILPSKLLLRNLYRLLKTRTSWQDQLLLDPETIKDLRWWSQALTTWNGKAVTPFTINTQLTTDASSTGWGAHMDGKKAMGFWNQRMSQEHSNYRELMAVVMAIQSFSTLLEGRTVQLLSDNITTIAYLNNLGGSQRELSQLATAIWAECYRLRIQLLAKHLAGSRNTLADQLSRVSPKYEWMLHPGVFRHIDRLFGPHDVDRFASMTTAQLPMYNSYVFDPQSSGVDALAQDNWGSLNNYVNAPFRLLPRILDILQAQQAVATVIAPWWPAQPWFRRLQAMSFMEPLQLPLSSRTVLAVNTRAEPLRNPRWTVYAWRVSGRTEPHL